MERRELLKIAAVAATATRLADAQGQHRFLSHDQFLIADELMEIIIPADDHSPGARAAGCAAFLDARLAEEPDQTVKEQWTTGLRMVDQLSASVNAMPFLAASPAARIALVERMAASEADPQAPEQLFFAVVKHAAVRAYYSSKIGIHQEMEYKGNVLLNEFVGTLPAEPSKITSQ
jgi:hypothetical protein